MTLVNQISTIIKSRDSIFLFGFITIYFSNLIVGKVLGVKETEEVIPLIVIFGFIFTSLAWLITRNYSLPESYKSVREKEGYVITGLVVYITIFIILGNSVMFLSDIPGNAGEAVTLFRKVLVFVIVPFLIYKILYGFSLKDFGLSAKWNNADILKSLLIFLLFSTLLIILNYFAGTGAKPLRDGTFASIQIIKAIPLLAFWLFIEVGLVEEFFFRGFLQSRLSAILKSGIGAILISALIFGLVHAPGMYLREAGINDGLGSNPTLLNSIVYCIAIQSIPGLFLGILWERTRNLWLFMGIHAMFDLMPGLPEFINIWGIS